MDSAKAKKLAKLLDFERDFKDNPEVTILSEIERVDFAIDETNEKITEIQDGAIEIVKAVNELDQTKADKEDVAQQIENIARMPGRPGNQGPAGKDYVLTPKDKEEIAGKIKVPVVEKVIEKIEVIKEQPIVTEIIKEVAKKDTGEEIIVKINDSEEQIDVERIKGLKSYDDEIATLQNRTQLLNQIATTRVTAPDLSGYLTSATAATTYLKLDQTTPQTVINGTPIFDVGLKLGSNSGISSDTSDGSDNKSVYLAGGGGSGITRGALFIASGNEAVSTGGFMSISSGNVSGAKIQLLAKGQTAFEVLEDKTLKANYYTTNGFVKFTNSDGTIGVDTATYLDTTTASTTYAKLDGTNQPFTGIITVPSLVTNTGGITIKGGQDIRPSADSTTAINIAQADGTDFVTFDTTNKRVGIGTAAPVYPLDVYSTASPFRASREVSATNSIQGANLLRLVSTGDMTDGFGPSFLYYIRDTAGVDNLIGRVGAVRSGADTSGSLVLYTSNAGSETEKMRIDNAGNVGIGTTAPTTVLHVEQNQNAASSIRLLNTTSGTAAREVILLGQAATGGTYGVFQYLNSGYTTDGLWTAGSTIIATSASGSNGLILETDADIPIIFATGGHALANERMRILGTGNVGIGVTSPTAVLHLKAGTATASTAPLKFTSGTLTTAAEAGAVEFLTDKFYGTITTGAARKEFALMDAAGTVGSVYFGGTNGRITQDNANFYWDDTNNRLGIGTTAPDNKLTISGSAQFDGINFFDSHASYSNLFTGLGAPRNNADFFGNISIYDGAGAGKGGLQFSGFTNGDSEAFVLGGLIGSTTPTKAPVALVSWKWNGTTSVAALASTEKVLSVFNGSTEVATILGGGSLGLGTAGTVSARLHSLSTTEQLRLGYDASNYLSATIGSTGSATFALTGTTPINIFSQAVKFAGGTQSSDGSAGLSATYTFDATTPGNITSMTFKNGLLTAVATLP